MNMKFNRTMPELSLRHSSGMSLLDVLLGVVIFVVGMLALASLQGNLTRSTAEGNARTVGTNIAEEFIEELRVFDELRATATCPTALDAIATENVYQCIVDGTAAVTRNGLDYTVTVAVDDYYFMPDGVTLTDDVGDLPSGRDYTISNFKHLEMTVSWGANDFLDNEGGTIDAGDMGAGSFSVASIIPSIPQLGSAEIAAEDDGDLGAPPIIYTPGLRPDIVAINLTDSRFKESTTPMPDVKRVDELVETWFDVITYNTDNQNESTYLRREEFLVITCECTLTTVSSGDPTGFLPTVWNGEEYITGNNGEMVTKNYGVSASNQQSQYCDTCCRDHHDSDNDVDDEDVYDPARLDNQVPNWSESGGPNGDHKHYTRSNQGGLSEAGNNDNYVEACRMVRKDGFLRVAQDFRQEGLVAFPQGYLDTQSGVQEYSEYVTNSIYDFYDNDRNELVPPSGVISPGQSTAWSYDFPADRISQAGEPLVTDTTTLPLMNIDSQQMRSRSIFLDRLSPALEKMLECIDDMTAYGDCYVPDGVTSPLQVLPFYDIQTTWLAWWDSDPRGNPVSMTSETVRTDNSHSRGLAVLEDADAVGETPETQTRIHRGNIGLTVTDSITPSDDDVAEAKFEQLLYIDIGDGDGGDDDDTATGYTWTGTFASSVNQVDASNATVTPIGNTFCARSGTDMSCITPNGESGGMTITDYVRRQGQNYVDYWICLSNFPAATVNNVPDGINNAATITWTAGTDGQEVTGFVISIEASACP